MDARFKTRTALVCLVLLTVSMLLAQEPVKKAPVPDANAQAEATKLIKEVYGDQWAAAKTPAKKQALAKTLVQKGKETEKDEAGRFVLFRLARDIAAQASDSETAFQAIDEMNQSFVIDPVEMKATVLTKLVEAAKTTEQHKSLAEKAIALLDDAVSNDAFSTATQLGELASGEAKKARDRSLIKETSERTAEIEELAKSCEAVKQATATLDKTPADPEANLTVGKYRCFVKGDWGGGLPMLALGSDQTLKTLAAKERAGAASSDEQAKLGDEWWNLAETQEGRAKRQIQGRAAYWYRQALPGLSGLVKDKAEKRLAGIATTKKERVDRSGISKRPVARPGNKADAIVGKWIWGPSGPTALFREDGTAMGGKRTTTGKWKCLDTKTRKYQVSWSSGWDDWLLLSPDGATIVVKNKQNGNTFTAQRSPEP